MQEVTARAAALQAALEAGAAWLDPADTDSGHEAIERALTRLELGAEHTVVALVGATGGGKSSLFNALARMEIAQVGARRPLTSQPMACVWGEGGSQDLLDWLEVPRARRITRESVLDADRQAPMHGLVLLDLPDHDSTEVVHRVQVDRLVTMVDLLVWVVDPQKYGDDALHSGYLQHLTGHDDVMVVVLNQIDRLGPEEAATCVGDLRRLLDGDGLERVAILPVSATRGDGVDALRDVLAKVVRARSAITERLAADLQTASDVVASRLAPAEPGDGEPPQADRLVEELAGAAGNRPVLDAVAAEYRRRGAGYTGWPVLRWLRRLRPTALERLGTRVAAADLQVIAGSQAPVSTPVQRSRVELAVEEAVSASSAGLPQRWADAVRSSVLAGQGSGPDLVAALDQRVGAVELELAPPLWWRLVALAQYLLSLAAIGGALWLAVLGVTHLLGKGSGAGTPRLFGVLLPVIMLVAGLVGSVVLAGLSLRALVVGARRRRQLAGDRLTAAISEVAEARVIGPIRTVLAAHRAIRLRLIGGEAAVVRGASAGSNHRPRTPGQSSRHVAATSPVLPVAAVEQAIAAVPAGQAAVPAGQAAVPAGQAAAQVGRSGGEADDGSQAASMAI